MQLNNLSFVHHTFTLQVWWVHIWYYKKEDKHQRWRLYDTYRALSIICFIITAKLEILSANHVVVLEEDPIWLPSGKTCLKGLFFTLPADLGSSSLLRICEVRLCIRPYTLSQVLTGFSITFIEFTNDGLPVGASWNTMETEYITFLFHWVLLEYQFFFHRKYHMRIKSQTYLHKNIFHNSLERLNISKEKVW